MPDYIENHPPVGSRLLELIQWQLISRHYRKGINISIDRGNIDISSDIQTRY